MPTTQTPDSLNQTISLNLRTLRKAKGMTLDEVAELTGISKSMLGQIERGDCGPSVSTLWKICAGLKISFTSLMTAPKQDTMLVENKSIVPLESETDGFRLYPIMPIEPSRSFEILYIEIDPGAKVESAPHEAGTEEYAMVYCGEFSVNVNGDVHTVKQGYSIQYRADFPHIYENKGDDIVKLYMIIHYI